MIITKEQINEGNELIFASPFINVPYSELIKKFMVTGDPPRILSGVLQYHSNYSWIMPVIEKIEKCRYKGFSINVTIGSTGAHIGINPTNAMGEKFDGQSTIVNTFNMNYFNGEDEKEQISKKEAIYLAVVEFIKWYNKNKENVTHSMDK